MQETSDMLMKIAILLQNLGVFAAAICSVVTIFMGYAKWSASKKDDVIAKKMAIVANIINEAVSWVEEQDWVKMKDGQKLAVNKAQLALNHVKVEYERTFGEHLDDSDIESVKKKIDAAVNTLRFLSGRLAPTARPS